MNKMKLNSKRIIKNRMRRIISCIIEELLDGQLSRNKLTSKGISTVRPSGEKIMKSEKKYELLMFLSNLENEPQIEFKKVRLL